MIERIIDFSVRRRWLILLITLAMLTFRLQEKDA